jgi:hypothetical protein
MRGYGVEDLKKATRNAEKIRLGNSRLRSLNVTLKTAGN